MSNPIKSVYDKLVLIVALAAVVLSVGWAWREQAGIRESLIRIAVGLEHVDDLKTDMLRGFAGIR